MFDKQTSKLVTLSLSLLLLGQGLPVLTANAAGSVGSDVLTGDVRVTVSPANLQQTLPIIGASRKVTMAFHGVDVQDALRALAKKGGFNVLIDESVTGTVSVEWNNVSIQDALDNLKTYSKLAYGVKGNNLMVATADSDKGKSFQKSSTRIIPLRNANAKTLANLLNSTVFADRAASSGGSSGGSTGSSSPLPVTADYHTNSLIVVGSPADIRIVEEHVAALDKAREMKTWRLSQANALDVATLLSSSLFNEGQPALISSGGGSSSSSTSGSQGGMPSTMRVTAEKVQDGQGTSQSSQSGGSSGGSQSSIINSMTLRARIKENQTIQVNPNGPIIIPDTRLNTITLMGTAEQIAMAEALIPTLDRKVPQVVLEASLVELSEDASKELGYSSASTRGNFSTGTNNNPAATTIANKLFSGNVGRTTSNSNPLESIFRFTTNPKTNMNNFAFQINALLSKRKAKMLANPTVITTSDSETVISIVDEIISSVTVTQGFGLPPSATTNIGEAGIVLNILPRVGADDTVTMRVRPVVSTVAGQRTDRFGNVVTLLSKREVLTQNVVLHDGETFVLGGLVQNTSATTVARNPLLSQLPIVGALARNTSTSKHKTELVLIITPHIINDDAQVARSQPGIPGSQIIPATLSHHAPTNGEPGMVPVAFNGLNASNQSSVLPPLEGVHAIGSASAPVSEIPDASNSASVSVSAAAKVKPSPRPVTVMPLQQDELKDMLPSSMMSAPKFSPSSNAAPSAPTVASGGENVQLPTHHRVERIEPTRPVTKRPAKAGEISDDTIRAIMNKFK